MNCDDNESDELLHQWRSGLIIYSLLIEGKISFIHPCREASSPLVTHPYISSSCQPPCLVREHMTGEKVLYVFFDAGGNWSSWSYALYYFTVYILHSTNYFKIARAAWQSLRNRGCCRNTCVPWMAITDLNISPYECELIFKWHLE